MAIKCFGCGGEGHIEPNCPNTSFTANGWCGICDERTRLIDLGDKTGRCTVCHPLRGQQLKQHRKCPRCHMTVYEYDGAPCGQHASPEAPDKRPDRQHIEQIVAAP
jgi:phage FluMu protein Com